MSDWKYHSGVLFESGAQRCYYNEALDIYRITQSRFSHSGGWSAGRTWFETQAGRKKFSTIREAIEAKEQGK